MKLLAWYAAHGRDLPWRKTRNPYSILVSEIMLQQTQVDRVIPKYRSWLKKFPTWKKLSQAKRSQVLQLWSGLGYNSRAVRLHALSKLVVEEFDGVLPTTEEELVKLPGIGPYTAGALMAFAYNKPGSCIDVNIERIVKRFRFGKSKKVITKKELEEEFLSMFPDDATAFANAMMDFGSLICTASNPKCDACPLYDDCKSKGERAEEKKERAKKKQSTFLHSNRWWRGQILKAVNTGEQPSEQQLFQKILKETLADDTQAYHTALMQLKAEGLVVGKRLRIGG